jgi:hypothetical protein
MSYRKTLGVSLIALGMAVSAVPAIAAPAAPAPEQAGAASTQSFPDAKLNSYATANAQVEQLNQHYATQAQAATDPADKQKIEQEKNAKLAEVVTKSGLTVDEYNQIYMASKTDSALAAKIASLKQPASSPPSRIQ